MTTTCPASGSRLPPSRAKAPSVRSGNLGSLGRLDEGAPVVDAYDQRPAVGDIGDLDTGAERQLGPAVGRSRGVVRVVVEEFSAGGERARWLGPVARGPTLVVCLLGVASAEAVGRQAGSASAATTRLHRNAVKREGECPAMRTITAFRDKGARGARTSSTDLKRGCVHVARRPEPGRSVPETSSGER